MTPLEKVQAELSKYRHKLLEFDARGDGDGSVVLLIRLRRPVEGAHIYEAPLHPRDIGLSQFEWNFQRYLYDCLHDYLVELFDRTPQNRD